MDDGINMGLLIGILSGMLPEVDPSDIESYVNAWLTAHPEATTTVQDGSITLAKLAADLAAKINSITQLSDEIDNIGSDVTDLKSAIDDTTKIIKSRNLLNYNSILEGMVLDYNSAHTTYGEPISDQDSITTGYIPVVAGKTYYSTKEGSTTREKMTLTRYAYYKSDKSLLSYAGDSNTGIITAPENAVYMRASLRNTTTPWTKQGAIDAKWMIYEFDPLYYQGMPFEAYSESVVVDSNSVDTERSLGGLYSVSKNRNLLTYGNIIDKIILNSDGTISISVTGCTTEFIEIKSETDYIMSFVRTGSTDRAVRTAPRVCYYDASKTFLSYVENKYALTTPPTAKYLRASWWRNDIETAAKIATTETVLEEGDWFSSYIAPDGEYRIDPVYYDAGTKDALNAVGNMRKVQKGKQGRKRLCRIAHRGIYGNTTVPENTIPAFELAASKEYDYSEFDVQVTSDGKFVIFHDKKITIGGVEKYVYEYTLAEIKTYRYPQFSGTEYADTEIPTFEETLQCFAQNNILPVVEIKNQSSEITFAQLQEICGLLEEYGFDNTAIIYASDTVNLSRLNEINPHLILGPYFTTSQSTQTITRGIRSIYNGMNTIVCFLPIEHITDANAALIYAEGADYIAIGANLGGEWHQVTGKVVIPNSIIKYVHFVMDNNTETQS